MKFPRRRSLRIAFFAVVVFHLLVVAHAFGPPDTSLAWRSLFDAGHAPLFGAIALATLGMLSASPLADRCGRPTLYALAFALTLLMGGISELSQVNTSRDSNPWDVARDALGAGAFLFFAATLDPHLLQKPAIRRATRVAVRVAAFTLLALAFIPVALAVRAYAHRAAALPLLFDFAGGWERDFVRADQAEFVTAPLPGDREPRISATRITFFPARFSSLKLLEPYPDWTGYDNLHLAIYSDLDRSVHLTLRIHDHAHDNRFADRFNRELTIQPGENRFTIPLEDVRGAPADREMDMTSIRRLNLFAIDTVAPFSVYLVDLRLEAL